MKIGPKLTMSHVLMALAPVVLLAGALLYIFQGSFGQLGHVATTEGVEVVVAQASDALAAAATERLKVVHDSKQHEVEHIVEQMLSESSYLGRSTRTYEIFEGMKYYHDFGGLTPENTLNIASPTYSTLYDDANRYFGDFVDSKSYRELFLLCSAHGHVLYSYQKNSDLGANVGEGPLRDEGLGRAWAQVVETGQTCLVDYSRYSPPGARKRPSSPLRASTPRARSTRSWRWRFPTRNSTGSSTASWASARPGTASWSAATPMVLPPCVRPGRARARTSATRKAASSSAG